MERQWFLTDTYTMRFVKAAVIVFWLASALSWSSAAEVFFQTPAELSEWLKSKPELGAEEYRQVHTTIEYFDEHHDIDRDQAILLGQLAADRGVARFMRLRESGVLLPAMDLFHSTLRSRVLEVLQEGKDPAFSARIVHEAMERKQWWVFPIHLDMELTQGRIYDDLMGGPETRLPYMDRESSPEGGRALKKALEKKWPEVLKEAVTARERKHPVQEVNVDTVTGAYSKKERPGNPGSTDDKGAAPWLIGILALLAVAVALVFIKNRQ